MKTINQEVKRNLKTFEIKYINQIVLNGIGKIKVLKIYNSIGSNWNLILIKNGDNQYFISIPKTEFSCSPSGYGDIEHAKKYNEFINLN